MAESNLPKIPDDEEFGPQEDEIVENFNESCEKVKKLVTTLSSSILLELYGFYKQATIGPCNTSRPSWFAMEAKQKWDAWNKLGNMSATDAMNNYIRLVQQNDMKSNESNNKASWINVSTMVNSDSFVDDQDKTVFDWVKEGDLEMLKRFIKSEDVASIDSEGMGLIHWAADRGDLDIIKFLVCDMKADLEIRDSEGQTATHYAASCGHVGILKFLITNGADLSVVDNDGMLPKDHASDDDVLNLLS